MIRRNPDALAITFILLLVAFFGVARNVGQRVRWEVTPIHSQLMVERDQLKAQAERFRTEGQRFRAEGQRFRTEQQRIREELRRAFCFRSI